MDDEHKEILQQIQDQYREIKSFLVKIDRQTLDQYYVVLDQRIKELEYKVAVLEGQAQ